MVRFGSASKMSERVDKRIGRHDEFCREQVLQLVLDILHTSSATRQQLANGARERPLLPCDHESATSEYCAVISACATATVVRKTLPVLHCKVGAMQKRLPSRGVTFCDTSRESLPKELFAACRRGDLAGQQSEIKHKKCIYMFTTKFFKNLLPYDYGG